MTTGGGSKQQELAFLTLKKKILHFSPHSLHPLHRYLQAIGRRIQAFLYIMGMGEEGWVSERVSHPHIFWLGAVGSASGLTLGWWDVVTRVQTALWIGHELYFQTRDCFLCSGGDNCY